MEMKTLEQKVRFVMVCKPETRNNDNRLIYEFLKEYYNVESLSISDLLLNGSKLGIPSFESITRARRKIQETSPYLRATEKIDKIRYTHTLKIRDYLDGKTPTNDRISCEITRKVVK